MDQVKVNEKEKLLLIVECQGQAGRWERGLALEQSFAITKDENIIKNKASGGDGIPDELFQILKDDAV